MDNKLVRNGIKNVLSAILSQGLILILSFVSGLILPKEMGPAAYGYWQSFLFYMSWLNLMGLGFNDGLVLHYGGDSFNSLPHQKLSSAIVVFYLYIGVASIFLSLISFLVPDSMISRIVLMLGINTPVLCIQCILLSLFLAVNRIGYYNGINLITKIISTIFFIIIIIMNKASASNMMIADTLARVLTTLPCMWMVREVMFARKPDLVLGKKEFKEKSVDGLHITLGLLAASFIPLAGRFVVEWTYSRVEYGIYSFVSSLMMIIITFTSAAGMVVFPILKRLNHRDLPRGYQGLSYLSSFLIGIALLLYIPLVMIIRYLLPEYISALGYLHVIFAACIPLGKVHLLQNSFYKALRLEHQFFKINVTMMLLALGVIYVVNKFYPSLLIVAAASSIMVYVWYSRLDSVLLQSMGLRPCLRHRLTDGVIMGAFISAASQGRIIIFAIIYGTILIVTIINSWQYIKDIFRSYSKLSS